MYFAQNLKFLRLKAGEKQKDLSDLLGVSEMTISRYESGDNEPDLTKTEVIARHYDISLDELLTEKMLTPPVLYMRNLKYLRQKYGIKQKEIIKLLDLKTESAYSKKENGSVPFSVDEVIKLAEYYGITLDSLVSNDLANGGA